MFGNPSLTTRISVGKLVGFIFGLIGLICLPYLYPEAGWMIRWGILLWYVTLGAIIGAFGFYTQHPVLKFPMPWWLRDPLMGAWMNFVLVLFAYDAFAEILKTMFGSQSIMTSPFWFVLEGAIVGLVIGYFAKRFGGEGPDVLAR